MKSLRFTIPALVLLLFVALGAQITGPITIPERTPDQELVGVTAGICGSSGLAITLVAYTGRTEFYNKATKLLIVVLYDVSTDAITAIYVVDILGRVHKFGNEQEATAIFGSPCDVVATHATSQVL